LIFVLAGGVGNLVDRVYYRVWDKNCLYGVRDMVDLSRFGFAVCNFADFFICAGAAILVVAFLFFDKDAVCPVGKYKKLAKEAEEQEKEQEKAVKANAESVDGENA
jgi:lipoprotein signal peptidase